MARTPNLKNDSKITAMLARGVSVSAIAAEVGVSDPSVYNAIRRLGLTLPSKSAAPAAAKRVRNPQTKTPQTKNPPTKTPQPTATKPAVAKAAASRPRRANTRGASRPPTSVAAPDAPPTTPGTSLVPVTDNTLLTVRVEQGVELLKNLSARIVKHERELAAARQRYADTLAALALN